MNRETEIAMFRSRMLPYYMDIVKKSKYKQCLQCGDYLPLDEFSSENITYCKRCEKIRLLFPKKETLI